MEEGIQGFILVHFCNVYASSRPLPDAIAKGIEHLRAGVDFSTAEELLQPYTTLEVKQALFQMAHLKSPEPDGMSSIFFQKFWHIVGRDVTTCILHLLNSFVMPHDLNSIHLVLIPKCKHPEGLTQFRPISFCNVVYKIASKVIANRLKVFLDRIISPAQSTFMPDRRISDNILFAFEQNHFLDSKTEVNGAGWLSNLTLARLMTSLNGPFWSSYGVSCDTRTVYLVGYSGPGYRRCSRCWGCDPPVLESPPPPQDCIKVNFDGATLRRGLELGTGVIARDTNGDFVAWFSRCFHIMGNAETAKAMAAREAIRLALRGGWSSIIIEGDCYTLIQKLRSSDRDLSVVGPIVMDIQELVACFHSCVFQHVKRSCNRAAHYLAQVACAPAEGGHLAPPAVASLVQANISCK
ncbi:UNVERIFIED_CONTAM: hypothetical protein Sradi_5876200 [Sesamum radiatum]|uniref:RNase H type-1 domain-containing protein n=1 Tax=Sesamum radiatum TaxID=300843 RepID=A0AAW2KSN3_SESRA